MRAAREEDEPSGAGRNHDGPFRDPVPGAEARRRHLLSRRRDDMVATSGAIRAVYVRRCGRIGAALAAAIPGLAALGLALLEARAPALGNAASAVISAALPGRYPAPLATLSAVALASAGIGYLLGRYLGERWFTRTLFGCALPSESVFDDLERLSHETPEAAGRRAARRIEGESALSVAAVVGLLLPLAAIYGAEVLRAGRYPAPDHFEASAVGSALALATAFGLAITVGLVAWEVVRRAGARSVARCARACAASAVLLAPLGAAIAGTLGAAMAAGAALLGYGLLAVAGRERVALGLGADDMALDVSVRARIGRATAGARRRAARACTALWGSRLALRIRRGIADTSRRSRVVAAVAAGSVGAGLAGAWLVSNPQDLPDEVVDPGGEVAGASSGVAAGPASPRPQAAEGPGASLRSEGVSDGGALIFEYRYEGAGPPEAEGPGARLPAPPGSNAAWRPVITAEIVDDDRGDRARAADATGAVGALGLSPFPGADLEYGETWRFVAPDCEREPRIAWRAAAPAGAAAPEGAAALAGSVRVAWTLDLEACEPE